MKEFLEKRIDSKAKSNATFAFIVSTFISIILYSGASLTSGTISSGGASIVFGQVNIWALFIIAILYVAMILGIWLVVDAQERRDAEDVYSIIRKALEGAWTASYRITDGESGPIVAPDPLVGCEIYINEIDKKLEMKFIVDENPIWHNGDQLITVTSIREISKSRYGLIYYFKGRRRLCSRLEAHLIYLPDNEDGHGIDIEVLGVVEFDLAPGKNNKKTVNEMQGEWFDLSGAITKVFSFAKDVYQLKGGQFLQKNWSDADIHEGNYSARMGRVRFRRIDTGNS
jgi:hypothetical protein